MMLSCRRLHFVALFDQDFRRHIIISFFRSHFSDTYVELSGLHFELCCRNGLRTASIRLVALTSQTHE